MVSRLKHWWRGFRHPPVVSIAFSGQRTDRPQVHVSACGLNGAQTVYTWDATDQGNACATMYGRGLALILQRRLVDQRASQSDAGAKPK